MRQKRGGVLKVVGGGCGEAISWLTYPFVSASEGGKGMRRGFGRMQGRMVDRGRIARG